MWGAVGGDEAGHITVAVVGPLRVHGPDGADLTPSGTRARALLGVLALSPGNRRGRRRLEAMLWPDRGAAQASGSLRQTLCELRRALGRHGSAIVADRADVALDMALARVDAQPASGGEGPAPELLEGVDIPSDDFEDWLREIRTAACATHVKRAARRLDLVLDPERTSDRLETFVNRLVADQLARDATESLNVRVLTNDGPTPGLAAPGVRFAIETLRTGSTAIAVARVIGHPNGEALWARSINLDGSGPGGYDADDAAALALEASEAIAEASAASGYAGQAAMLTLRAVRALFRFDEQSLAEAERLLREADRLDSHPVRPAWLALVRGLAAVERHPCDIERLKSEAAQLLEAAMPCAMRNGLALAILADVHDLLFDAPEKAFELARTAVEVNPGSGYAWTAYGSLLLRLGRSAEADAAAARARRISRWSVMAPWADMLGCLTAMHAGRFADAERAADSAAKRAPGFRPPLRHLYALKLLAHDEAGAMTTISRLRSLEPDFSLLRVGEDRSYPASTIRSLNLHKIREPKF